jgi:parallel beta-helix repeat protein
MGNRIEYRRGDLTEWYVNDERGLEQGVTLASSPGGRPQGSPLQFDLALLGNLTPALSDDGAAIEFTTLGGVRVLRCYSDLRAHDATGRALPAYLELPSPFEGEEPGVRAVVDDTATVYPITVYSLATTPNWTAESDQAWAVFGYSVATAGDVNGDGYADVIVGAPNYDNGQEYEGAAYVYHGSGLEPIAGLTATNDSPTPLGIATTLTATVTAGTDVAYTWAFGDGATDSGAVVRHTYPAVDIYTATIIASNLVSVLTATTTVTITECWARLNDDPTDYTTVQAAVDASTHMTDVVKVAGYCSGVEARVGMTQTVYISKTLALRGGYTITNWTISDPLLNPTTLDAQGQGRVLYITGDISPTIEGLRITSGDAAGLGGHHLWGDAGGGVYLISATATISNTQVFSNIAYRGGGLYLYDSDATLSGNTVSGNAANANGGGVLLSNSIATLSGNAVTDNTADQGGGLFLWHSDATLSDDTISGNTAYNGGGLCLRARSDATLSGNAVTDNTANDGGGLFLTQSDAALTNNVVADNQINSEGSGLFIEGSSVRLLHTTIAHNTGGDGSGVYVGELVIPLPLMRRRIASLP